jgi:hypothetical protein
MDMGKFVKWAQGAGLPVDAQAETTYPA